MSAEPDHAKVIARREARVARRAARQTNPYPRPKPIIFRYGPLHDLEALWWVSAYFLFAREPECPTQLPTVREKQLEAQHSAARRLFCDVKTRWKVLQFADNLLDEVACLHPLVRGFGDDLEQTRQELMDHYRHVEEDIEAREFDVPPNIYNTFRETWLTMSAEMQEDNIHVAYMDIHD